MPPILLDGPDSTGLRLRTALSLSLATGQPFRMTNLRRRLRAPGLRLRETAWIEAARMISNATVEGAFLRSSELSFSPGEVQPGSHQISIGCASTSLLLQTLLPALCRADSPSTFRIRGSTHGRGSPPFDFLERVYLRALQRAGISVKVRLLKMGFLPDGGGEITAEIQPCRQPSPLVLDRPEGIVENILVRVLTKEANLKRARQLLNAIAPFADDARYEVFEPGPSSKAFCMVEIAGSHVSEILSCPGITKPPRRIAKGLSNLALDWLNCGAPVGHHLANQLLVPMALAGPGSRILAMKPDRRVHIAIPIIEAFLPVKFELTPAPRGCKFISVLPRTLPM